MKVLYLDLNAPDLVEDYSRDDCKKYGGGRIVAAHLMPYLNDNGHHMEIWADERCFLNIKDKYKKFCKGLSYESRLEFIKGACISGFDIVLHNFPGVHISCSGKDFVWLVGYGETVNAANERIILYNEFQAPQFQNINTQVFFARIGVPIPQFKEYKKEAFVFSCHRQSKYFGSEFMMKLALKYKFKYVTAGPKDANFPNIMDYVDNNYVTYLGEISNQTKQQYFQRAFCSTYLHSWPTPFNLSACESLAYGTPILATRAGFWPSFVKQRVNGFVVDSEDQFCIALSSIPLISQRSCYDSVKSYSSDLMIQDYISIFNKHLDKK